MIFELNETLKIKGRSKFLENYLVNIDKKEPLSELLFAHE